MKNLLSLILLFTFLPVFSQEVTYNHDVMKTNQFTAMEVGYGPMDNWYYQLFHSGYASSAHQTNKSAQRTATYLATVPQVEYSDSIQEVLKDRAIKEAVVMADNLIDAPSIIEGSKIRDLLTNFQNNYSRITVYGGPIAAQKYYEECYKMYNFAFDRIGTGIMPNSVRERQYVALYDDISSKNQEVASYVISLRFIQRMNMRNGSGNNLRLANPSEVAVSRFGNWLTRAWGTARGGGL